MVSTRANRIVGLVYLAILLMVVAGNMWPLTLRLPIDRFCTARRERLTDRLEDLSPVAPEVAATLRARLDCADYLLTETRLNQWVRRLAAQRLLSQMERDLRALELGVNTLTLRRGTLLMAHVSALDDSIQPYWLWVPARYTGDRPFPLVVNLHYHGWYRPFQGYPLPTLPDALVVSPHARGSTDFMYLGEQEVLEVIRLVKQDYRIDPDRVYLVGSSMGGTGCWHLAVHYPDRFAALAPVSGNTNHSVWKEAWGWDRLPESPFQPVRERLSDMLDPVSFADNLEHVPVFCAHGVRDPIVPVDHSRTMVERVRAAGGTVRYLEFPDVAHGGFPRSLRTQRFNWLRKQRRNPLPRHVQFRTASLRHDHAYWVSISGFRHYGDFAEVEARVGEANHIRVRTQNVSRLVLTLTRSVREALGLDGDVTVSLDGALFQVSASAEEVLFSRSAVGWTKDSSPFPANRKRPGLSGPIEDAFLAPFLVVYGTGGTSREQTFTARAARTFSAEWQRRYGAPCRLKPDTDFTSADARRYNLILYGNEQTNAVLGRIGPSLPLRITTTEVRFHGRVYQGNNVGAKFCCPNPLNSQRYVVVFGATTWQGMFQLNGRFGNWFDWGVYDNRNWFDFAVFDDHTVSPETFLQVGFFGDDWKLDPTTTWGPVPALRRAALPRHVPTRETPPTTTMVFLSELLPVVIDQPKGTVQFDRSFNGGVLRVGRSAVARGLGVRAPSSVSFALGGGFTRFQATVGIDYEGRKTIPAARRTRERLRFSVFGDDRLLARSPELSARRPTCRLTADVTGVQTLTLTVTPHDSHLWLFGSAAWGNPRVLRE